MESGNSCKYLLRTAEKLCPTLNLFCSSSDRFLFQPQPTANTSTITSINNNNDNNSEIRASCLFSVIQFLEFSSFFCTIYSSCQVAQALELVARHCLRLFTSSSNFFNKEPLFVSGFMNNSHFALKEKLEYFHILLSTIYYIVGFLIDKFCAGI